MSEVKDTEGRRKRIWYPKCKSLFRGTSNLNKNVKMKMKKILFVLLSRLYKSNWDSLKMYKETREALAFWWIIFQEPALKLKTKSKEKIISGLSMNIIRNNFTLKENIQLLTESNMTHIHSTLANFSLFAKILDSCRVNQN